MASNLSSPPVLFDHSRHRLSIRRFDEPLDVLAFEGEEQLSQCFTYRIEFTSPSPDIAAEQVLGHSASFSLYPLPEKPAYRGAQVLPPEPLRIVYGVITALRRLSASRDEARYQVTLQPRLALADRGKQCRIYQRQSVPQIVESVLRERHRFAEYELRWHLVCQYPVREQVMQYDESDLAFIQRLLAEVGIWYCFVNHESAELAVVQFSDMRKGLHYGVELPYYPYSGLNVGEQDSVWNLQTQHQVVEKQVNVRTYRYDDVWAQLDADIDQARGDVTTRGEAYHYGDDYSQPGNRHAFYKDVQPETAVFYARLHHERYLNQQTRLTGTTTSPTLAPRQVLTITGDAPQAFQPRIIITQLTTRAARDCSFVAHFTAIPYHQDIYYRPPALPKPVMAGTLPARITSHTANDPYSHLDMQGRYKVSFLFDRDTWKAGEESLWLRLARPYAGNTHGLHLPLIPGTEVAIAFEQGDPDRPYIAHALHDSHRPDLVTKRNYRRNVLRTPANNKLRMDDTRGQEHVKLSTDFAGKSQLNLGHVVDAERRKRGEGFELRSDHWGAIRGGKGLFISADAQAKGACDVLTMGPATNLLDKALASMKQNQDIARNHNSRPLAIEGLSALQGDAKNLQAPAIVLSAPKGIAAVTPASLLLNSGDGLYVRSDDEINLAAGERLAVQAEQGVSLLARQEGMRLVSGDGPLEIESHGQGMSLIAQQDVTVQTVEGHLQLTAKQGITLGCGGGCIRITPTGDIEIHSPGLVSVKGQHRFTGPASTVFQLPHLPGSVCEECQEKARAMGQAFAVREAQP